MSIASLPEVTKCEQCGKKLEKSKDTIIWVSAGKKTPCCSECARR